MAVKINGWTLDTIKFTPQLAKQWLDEKNIGNRDKRPSYIKQLAGVMKRGMFALTPEGLIVGKSGRLLNGQHRLCAIVESGQTIDLLVFFGVDDSVFEKIDQGTRRRMDDLFRTDRRVQDAVNTIARLHAGNSLSSDQVKEYLYVFGPACEALVKACGTQAKGRSSGPVKAGIAILMTANRGMWEDIASLYRCFVLLEFEDLPPSVIALVKQLDNGTANTSRSNEAVVRAYRAFDPERRGSSKIQFSDMQIGELKVVIESLMKPQ